MLSGTLWLPLLRFSHAFSSVVSQMPGYNLQIWSTAHILPKLIVLFDVLFVSIVLLYVLFVCKCLLYYCHRVSTQLQLTNISYIFRVSQEDCARIQENVPYVKVHRYNPKHLYPKLIGYGGNGQRKVWSSCGSTYYTRFA